MKVIALLLLAVSLVKNNFMSVWLINFTIDIWINLQVSAKPKPKPDQKYDPRQDLTKVFDFAPSVETGVQTAITERKPIMIIVHATYCSACKALLPDMVASKDLKELSKDFVVIHSVDGSEPIAETIGPDGKYFPRFD